MIELRSSKDPAPGARSPIATRWREEGTANLGPSQLRWAPVIQLPDSLPAYKARRRLTKSFYRTLRVSRGLDYNYYFSSPRSRQKPYIFFIHGFPSTSYDWHHQVSFFKEKGYGIIVPDMLGYGGTSKPTDPKFYRMDAIAHDLIDILDVENISKAIFVGHDWGCAILSRLLLLHPSRLHAAAFLSVGYLPPDPNFDYEKSLRDSKAAFGYELLGYFSFFESEEGSSISMDNLDTFLNILYPEDPKTWITDMGPIDAIRDSISSGKVLPSASWLSSEVCLYSHGYVYWLSTSTQDKAQQKKIIQDGGLAAPTCYYKAKVRGVHNGEDQALPPTPFPLNVPVFYGGAAEDFICLTPVYKQILDQIYSGSQEGERYTYREFKANHWLMMQIPDEVNKELTGWIQRIEAFEQKFWRSFYMYDITLWTKILFTGALEIQVLIMDVYNGRHFQS
ncbi:hypothetical protein D9758_010817 [Tetrapyrgos nigripes]|uniref:AB hydrolase-1 domain-containing protein n=1 Tax=Tetrapyrgos nigripes TaxID=182062 RepID=A0A8H5GIJ9_9AGAR|nr:hypothetical protein D9758_010817 [Tetrapyrgos nigripes]